MSSSIQLQLVEEANRQIYVGENVPIKAWTKGVQFESGALAQLQNLASLPFIYKHLAVMPDVHAGIGSTVGSVVPTTGVIIPAVVGVDLGCGCAALRTSLRADQLPDNLSHIRAKIEQAVPHGRSDNGGPNDRGSWNKIPERIANAWNGDLREEYEALCERNGKLNHRQVVNQLCTLGTGNHFIELCIDEEQYVWIMLHSGSRGVGNRIGQEYIELAKRDMKRYFINLPDANLAYLPEGSEHFDGYVAATKWAQNYAMVNRTLMLLQVLDVLKHSGHNLPKFEITEEAINCHHNYVTKESHFGKSVWISRKGAIQARKGTLGIIPGSMGAKSYIVRGKGEAESFCSCSHGAGRKMSRTQAQNTFTLNDHRLATEGVECRKDRDVIDETPGAYKDIDAVMDAQRDLVDVVHTLKQVLCVKG